MTIVQVEEQQTALEAASEVGHYQAIAQLLLGFGSPFPGEAFGGVASVRSALPEAISIAQRQLDALRAPGAQAAAAARLEARLQLRAPPRLAAAAGATAATGSTTGLGDGDAAVFPRLRLLLAEERLFDEALLPPPPPPPPAPLVSGEDAGAATETDNGSNEPSSSSPLGWALRSRFSATIYRAAWAAALLSCAEAAAAIAAERSVALLRQLGGGVPRCGGGAGSRREREKLVYAAAVCVARWAGAQRAELGRAREEVEKAGREADMMEVKGRETVERLQLAARGQDEA